MLDRRGSPSVYRPDTLPGNERLPIVAWGNGACRADGTWFRNILTEFASHGFLVIANGEPGGSGGRVGVNWLKWQLKGDTTARGEFAGPNCGLCSSDWNVLRRNLS
ncbi:hypothetical protein [Streptomyces sp. NPDC016626]|uniref:hypothetical protein n=1 Tax=Streptomyces sp. NPDC016626 TaxID=3364968 RepID=UPI0037029D10